MTATELINLLDSMPDDVPVVIPGDGGHFDVLAVVYDPERDAVLLVAQVSGVILRVRIGR